MFGHYVSAVAAKRIAESERNFDLSGEDVNPISLTAPNKGKTNWKAMLNKRLKVSHDKEEGGASSSKSNSLIPQFKVHSLTNDPFSEDVDKKVIDEREDLLNIVNSILANQNAPSTIKTPEGRG